MTSQEKAVPTEPCLPLALLAEVNPPLPEEPAELGWYLATIGEATEIVRKVEAEGWYVGRNAGFLSTWEQLYEDFPGITMVHLIPEPEPVTLPWASQSYIPGIMRTTVYVNSGVVDENGNGHTGVAITMPPEQTREKARALWTAADQAEVPDVG